MPIVESGLAPLRNPRLAAAATSARPAWLWSTDGSRILWANATGAAIFGAATVNACTQRGFEVGDAAAAQIIRLAAALPAPPQERLERLRGHGGSLGRALTCACSRIVLPDGSGAMLVAAVEAAGPDLPLAERVRRLLADDEQAWAGFTLDGTLIYANAAALALLRGTVTLPALGIETLAATALETGNARGTARLADETLDVTAERLGTDDSRVLAVCLMPHVNEIEPGQNAAAMSEQSDAVAEPLRGAAAFQASTNTEKPAGLTTAPSPSSPADPGARRHPLRFVWQMDADGRFTVGSDEFIELIGPHSLAGNGRPWREIADALGLDPDNLVARAIATHETWSGLVVSWPIADAGERLSVELSGLPIFDRDRSFRGYRGFGVCRDVERLNALARGHRARADAAQTELEAPPPETIEPPAEAAAQSAAPSERPPLKFPPAAANVVPFRPAPAADSKAPAEPRSAPTLSPVERRAFRELAQELTARLREPHRAEAAEDGADGRQIEQTAAALARVAAVPDAVAEDVLLDRIPVGILIYRHDTLLYANRHFLESTGHASLDALASAGGLHALFSEPASQALGQPDSANPLPPRSLSIVTRTGERMPVDGRMVSVPWSGEAALALILTNDRHGGEEDSRPDTAAASAVAEQDSGALEPLLAATTDGVFMLDRDGRIISANARAAALFDQPAAALGGRAIWELLTDSEQAAREFFVRLRENKVAGEPLIVKVQAGKSPLTLAMRLSAVGSDRFWAVLSDATGRDQIDGELRNAKRDALRAAAAKADFLAKVSHEIRTPLNAMIGFAEVIAAERFGPIGNERYREYLKDMHAAGTHVVSMLNDLLDLSKVETGQVELNFVNVKLNELTQQCVGIMQPQANRARILIRTAFTPRLPFVIADERTLRQIVLNLIANSIRSTGPGGQIIVSSVLSDSREVVLRVRDTGNGMTEKDIAAALQPFGQADTSASWGSGGTGYGLPLTKALSEANRANFGIKSAPNAGTLIEIAFPPDRLVAE